MRQSVDSLQEKITKPLLDDQLKIDNYARSLKFINLAASGFQLLNSCFILMNNLGDSITGVRRLNPELLINIGVNSLQIANDFSLLLNTDEISLFHKAIIVLHTVLLAGTGVLGGLWFGFKVGYKQGKGWETLSSIIQSSVVGGASGFFNHIAKSFRQSLEKRKIDSACEITELKNWKQMMSRGLDCEIKSQTSS
ncbi:MAG: hypothetical protein H0U75_13485 [Legionella sp.]|nr:hypothetical protein [Legionella sp.]